MKRSPEYLQQRFETCRKLFFQYEGREHARIEREMRANGFPDFNRRSLYARGVNSGWIEKYRWDRALLRRAVENAQLTVDNDLSEPGTVATRLFDGAPEGTSRQDAKPQSQNQEDPRLAVHKPARSKGKYNQLSELKKLNELNKRLS